MASNNERLWCSIIGAGIGLIRSSNSPSNRYLSKNEKIAKNLVNTAIGAGLGVMTAEIIGSPNDTVNYELQDKKGNTIYHGIAFEDRLEKRMSEHKRDGKEFTDYDYDGPRPRTDALKLEAKRIKRDQPKLNKQGK